MRGGRFVCAVCSFSVQKCQRPAHCCFFFSPPPPSLFRVLDGGRSADMARSTNKQTEGIKIEKNRADETWRWCVFIAARLMACSSHYSPLCPLPPIGCDNTAWQGCQCHVISCFCLTTRTTRAVSHQDGVFLPLAPQVAVSSRRQRSFTLDLIKKLSLRSQREFKLDLVV